VSFICPIVLESVGPELRQYIVTDNDSERPFSRDQRRWVYASAKRENNYFGFGSDNDMEVAPNYLIIKHQTFPLASPHPGGMVAARPVTGLALQLPMAEGRPRVERWPLAISSFSQVLDIVDGVRWTTPRATP